MKVVVQRSKKSSVSVSEKIVNEIDNGMVLLVSFTQGDTIDNILKMTKKIANLRIFDDEEGVIKKIVYGPNFIELHSINPMYPVRRFENENVLRIRVFGLVRSIKRKF